MLSRRLGPRAHLYQYIGLYSSFSHQLYSLFTPEPATRSSRGLHHARQLRMASLSPSCDTDGAHFKAGVIFGNNITERLEAAAPRYVALTLDLHRQPSSGKMKCTAARSSCWSMPRWIMHCCPSDRQKRCGTLTGFSRWGTTCTYYNQVLPVPPSYRTARPNTTLTSTLVVA
jgi:hypothetical protein